jgi:glycosyltransferase involved in cell wall biosynthesis
MNNQFTTLPISVVIPTFSEEVALPKLLRSLEKQVFKPQEIIVSDAQSSDRTREIARAFGCKVVEGGKIAFGRNAGARAATQEFILFLDADTELPNSISLVTAFVQFIKKKVDVASARFDVSHDEPKLFGRIAGGLVWILSNAVRTIQSFISYPKWEGGAFILVKKETFDKIGGFDENLGIGEDRSFFQQAVKLGYRYKMLPVNIETSARRFDRPEKLVKLIAWSFLETAVLATGVYAGSALLKRFWKWYGRLGGGAGKDPNED